MILINEIAHELIHNEATQLETIYQGNTMCQDLFSRWENKVE